MSLLTLLFVCLTAVTPLTPGNHSRTLQFDGRTRSWLVHVPPGYDGKQPVPVVLALHGGGSNADQLARVCGLNEKADQAGFLVVYPNGTGRMVRALTWNGGNCCAYAMWNKVDDVGFIRVLLDELAKVANVDAKRVYATGMSNGAIMTYRLAAELSDRIAAIAPVSGTMGTESCQPSRPVPVLHFHGTEDDFIPFKGGRGPRSLTTTEFIPVERSIQNWGKANGCPEKPVVTQLPVKIQDGTSVEQRTYGPGKDGAEVILMVISGGGHTWPGREPTARFLGKTTKNLSADDLLWEFFQRHPMK